MSESDNRIHAFVRKYGQPEVFYDIGANDPFAPGGLMNTHFPVMPDTKFYLIEAAEKHVPALERTGLPYAVSVLSDKDGREVTFFETKAFPRGTGDSYYCEATAYYRGDNLILSTRKSETLGTLRERMKWPKPTFLKLDTQGSELDILRGAIWLLPSVKFVQLEVSVERYNHGAPMFADVMDWMDRYDYRMIDVFSYLYNPSNDLSQMDVLFAKKN